MKVEKLRKTCGYILYIKSIIALVVTIILIFGGITMAIMGKHMVDNPGQGDKTGFEGAVGSCSTAFFGALGIVFGIVSIVVGCLLTLDAIFSMWADRRAGLPCPAGSQRTPPAPVSQGPPPHSAHTATRSAPVPAVRPAASRPIRPGS